MFKQVCFFRKRPDMTMDEFIDYYENQHSRLSSRMGRSPSIPERGALCAALPDAGAQSGHG